MVGLRGNTRYCVYTEPMWGLSLNLILPYMSVYMLALGLNDADVGMVASIYMVSQVIFSFLSGALTDKLGRRKAVAIFDFIGWCAPCIIWFFAVDLKFFIVAALFNGAMKVPVTAWSCLMIEDADKDKITKIYTWISVSGHLSAFFSPISSLLISRFTLIPAFKILIVNAFIVMTAKIIILYAYSRETTVGERRLAETRDRSYFDLLKDYAGVFGIIKKSRGLVFSIAIVSLFSIISVITSTFWQILVSKKLGLPDESLPYFTMVRSLIALIFYFTIISRINQTRLKKPLIYGFALYFAGQSALLLIPSNGSLLYVFLCVALFFEGLGAGILVTLGESMIAMHAGLSERARVLAIYQMIVMAASTPFGWIGGQLSTVSRNLPFVLNLSLIIVGIILTAVHFRTPEPKNR